MIPNERGIDLTLHQCYYGDENHQPIKAFVKEMDANPQLKKLSFGIEGLITRLGAHPAGILILEGNPAEHNSIMKTSKGIVVSAFDLKDSEKMGGLKYDLLTVQALDKIHATLNYLLEDQQIEWQGSLRATYDKYLLPANLDYDNKEMWDMLGRGEIIDVFQFDTMVGGQAIRLIKPRNIAELSIANSIMRLMAQDNMELPLDTFVKFKNDLMLWYHEMTLYGLTEPEIDILEPHLRILYGVADSQEAVMLLVMDEKISGFTLNEANLLRKAIAKKDFSVLEKAKDLYYEKGIALGTSRILLNYVWNVQVGRQIGYSFSVLHTMAYSTIALQQMNLAYFYPSIFWKTACLSVNAGAINEEDYYNLVEEGVIELSDEEDKRNQNKIQYGKVASAISNMRSSIDIRLPDINLSRMGFTPDLNTNSILYGIKGITRVGDQIIQEIILNRPYYSLKDFIRKLNTNRTLISKDKVMNLIKAGAFDRIEKKPRIEILRDFIETTSDQKQRLTLQNFLMLIKKNMVPDELTEEKKCYNFTKYIRKNKVSDNYYGVDDIAAQYLTERFPKDRILKITHNGVEVDVISRGWWDGIYEYQMNKVRDWIRTNHTVLLKKLNKELFQEEFNKYAKGDFLDWELQALNFFHSGHPLTNVQLPVKLTKLDEIVEGAIEGHFLINGKSIPKMVLYTIAGTVIDKDRVKSIVTLSTPEGVIDVKLYKQQFAKYVHESKVDEDDENYEHNEENFLEKGTHLLITGVKRGDMFVPKVYKNTRMEVIYKIVLDENREFIRFMGKGI